jgi:AraC-like DNA-binding protein
MDATLAGAIGETWSSAALPPAAQFDAWREVIVDAHLAWDIPTIRCEQFPAYMHQHRIDGVRLTDCNAPEPVRGTRRRAQIAHDSAAYLNVVMIGAGSETLSFGDGDAREVHLTEGMFTLWDSTRTMHFATGEGLRQMSLIVPEEHLLRRVPRVRDLIGRPIDGTRGIGALFVDHFHALLRHLPELSAPSRRTVLDATLDVLGLCLGEQPALPAPRLRHLLLQQLHRHIEDHLTDPDLGIAQIARAFRMTERNVHKLFEGSGATVCGYIRTRRLAMCRRDLEGSTLARRQITEIAGHWGFDDPSQFSKLFRAAFGLSPRDFRAQADALRHQQTVAG